MDRWDNHVTPILEEFERNIQYAFPLILPDYDTFGIIGWEPATEEIKTATRDILGKLEDILDITFNESSETKATNVISVGTSNQTTTAVLATTQIILLKLEWMYLLLKLIRIRAS